MRTYIMYLQTGLSMFEFAVVRTLFQLTQCYWQTQAKRGACQVANFRQDFTEGGVKVHDQMRIRISCLK